VVRHPGSRPRALLVRPPVQALALFASLFFCAHGMAQSLFAGTWRPDPQRAGPGEKPDTFQLLNGEYECQSCRPPYKIKADGVDHPITGNPRYDSLRIVVVNDHTLSRILKKSGHTIADVTVTVSPDGARMTQRQIVKDAGPRTVDFTSQYSRVSAGLQGSHKVSGTWQFVEADLTNHDEDTTYEVIGDTVSMTDRMGRSFTARVDGTDAPYKGSPEFTSVSLKLIDSHTLEETDKKDGHAVKVQRWAIDPDGRTIHGSFDDTHGHVMHQSGHKLP
jgi:hypothetical protein